MTKKNLFYKIETAENMERFSTIIYKVSEKIENENLLYICVQRYSVWVLSIWISCEKDLNFLYFIRSYYKLLHDEKSWWWQKWIWVSEAELMWYEIFVAKLFKRDINTLHLKDWVELKEFVILFNFFYFIYSIFRVVINENKIYDFFLLAFSSVNSW